MALTACPNIQEALIQTARNFPDWYAKIVENIGPVEREALGLTSARKTLTNGAEHVEASAL